ncbi:MAG TPA: hypothetical protein PLO37_17465 [Candidatus Hydrogenedentes bacterium]|nr:hypothetical protein [Candidatus Hydrogenedentota bacterium]HPG68637.1 hypothetical protein [Candidatus Hydrogenedentota bacterium]
MSEPSQERLDGATHRWWAIDALLAAMFMFQVAVCLGIGREDAYISFRYARNLARGDGLVYNVGERVEGISNLLWTVTLAGLHRLGLGMDGAVYLMTLSWALAAFLVYRWTAIRLLADRPFLARVPLVLIAFMTAMPASYGNGLEGSAVGCAMALIIAGAALSRPSVLTAGAVLLVLNRPDGIGFAGIAGLWVLWRAGRRPWSWRAFWSFAILVGGTVAAVTLFRWIYFGDYIPNTVRAKSPGLYDPTFAAAALPYLRDYLHYIGLHVPLLALYALATSTRVDLVALFGLLTLFNFFLVYNHGGDWMIEYRLLSPHFPLMAFLAALGLIGMARTRRRVAAVLAIACCALAIRTLQPGEIVRNADRFPDTVRGGLHHTSGGLERLEHHIAVADLTEPDDCFLVESGGAPAYALDGVYVLEMNGLTNRDLTKMDNPYAQKRPATGTLNWPAIFAKQPTYILFNLASTFYYINEIADVPGVSDELDRFLVFQNQSLAEGSEFNLLLVRSDRPTLPAFMEDYGMCAPARDFVRDEYKGKYFLPVYDPETDRYRDDLFTSPWEAMLWESDKDLGEGPRWRVWNGGRRFSSRVPVDRGSTALTKALLDDMPLFIVVGVSSAANPECRITVRVQPADGPSRPVADIDAHHVDEGSFQTWFLAVEPSGVACPGRLEVEMDAESEGEVLLAAHRWCRAPLPAMPAPTSEPLLKPPIPGDGSP